MFLIVLLILALIPAWIASNKGRSFVKWYIYGLLLLIFALPHALLIKNDTITCPACRSQISLQATVCKYCQTKIKSEDKAEQVKLRDDANAKRTKWILIVGGILIGYLIIMQFVLIHH